MAAPSASERKACWDARDSYWKCLDDSKDDETKCQQLRQCFESRCPRQWMKYFDKRRDYLKYKAQLEAGGFEPAEAADKT